MPYVRRSKGYKRYSKKRYAGRRKFTKFNLYRRRGAKAQASQIYSLNRKVNYVYKACKKQVHYADSDDYNLNNVVVNTTGDHPHVTSMRDYKPLFSEGWLCRFDGDRVDANKKTFNNYFGALNPGTEKLRLKNGIVNFSIMKRHTDPDANEVITGFNGVVGMDIYIIQYKQPYVSTAESSLFGPLSQLKYNMTDILQPLNSGIWQYVKVLKHKRVYLNDFDYDGKFFKMKYKPYYKTLKTTKQDSGTANTDSICHTIGIAFRLFGESHDDDAKMDININFRQYFTI